MSDKIYLSTGELAKMLGVTKQTVIYYDRIGLICPAKRDEKDYRYYTLEQADELDSILTFRDLGVSIDMLKEYLSERNVKRCIDMLKKQKLNVDAEIKKLQRIQKKIEARTKLLEDFAVVEDLNKVEFVNCEKEYYMIEKCSGSDEKTYMQSFIRLCNHSKQLSIDFENPVCNIISNQNLCSIEDRKIECFGIKIPEDFCKYSIDWIEKPGGIYACTCHKGSYETMYLAYERLFEHIKKEGFSIDGNAYEMDLFSTLTSLDKDEYMKLISVKVGKI